MPFVHLQVISNYSLLQSTTDISALVTAAKQRGYQAIALTDFNLMLGQVQFYKECQKVGIKPIIGLQLDFKGIFYKQEMFPLVLLAKSNQGYQKLMLLSTLRSKGAEEELQQALGEGMEDIIAITPGEKGEIERLLFQGEQEKASEAAAYWQQIFAPNQFFLGVQIHQKMLPLLKPIKQVAQDTRIPVTAMHDIRYLNDTDRFSSKVLQAIGKGEQVDIEAESLTGEYYLPTEEEMMRRFQEFGLAAEAETTARIADQISVEISFNQSLLPKYPTPKDSTAQEYLLQRCLTGLQERVPDADERYQKRLAYELEVIHEMGFDDYFLIIWDVMDFAQKARIFPGAGRGSAAGSLVAYVLRITHVDPIRFNLLFERFLNRERYNMPDIDLDFPDDRRDEVLRYVKDKYGRDHVAQIMTVGTLAAKMSLRDTARVFGLTPAEASKWSNAVPNQLGIRLSDAYRSSKALQQLVASSSRNRLLFETAVRIEGAPRHISTHAAGVVISDQPLVELIPLQQREGDLLLTQYQMGAIEEIGLLKMDFLGLKNLTILNNAIQLLQKDQQHPIDIFSIPLDDEKTLELFRRSDTNGIFQFESAGIKNVLRKLSPTSFEDLVAVNALYRPGPMEQIDTFISRKKGQQSIDYLHPDLEPILDVTYGIMVYQEQVMQVASKLAGFTLGEADILRRAIGKKHKETLDRERIHFIQGAVENGYTEEKAEEVYHYIDRFANYGFNRSHSVAYSFIAYQMAYLKAHYPAAFFAALLNSINTHSDKMKDYILDVKKQRIELTYPDINQSGWRFSLQNQKIQFGLGGIKGLRRDFVKEILAERKENGPFQDFIQFLRRLSPKWLKEEMIIPLIGSGSFHGFGVNRATLLQSLPGILSSIEYSGSNIDLFQVLEPKYVHREELPRNEIAEMEEEYLGYALIGHPTEAYSNLYSEDQFAYIAELKEQQRVQTMGMLKEVKRIQTKKGDPMAFLSLTDSTGMISATLFPETYLQSVKHLKEGTLLVVSGKVEDNRRNGEKNLIAQKVIPLELYLKQRKTPAGRCFIRIVAETSHEENLQQLQQILLESPGDYPVILIDTVHERKILLDAKYHFHPTEPIKQQLFALFGTENVVIQ